METPAELMQMASDTLNADYQSSIERHETARKQGLWAVMYGLIPKRDGNQWCVLLGENLPEGIAAFGDTPEQAIENFQQEMTVDISG